MTASALRFLPWDAKLYRVVRRGWANPLDTSFSRTAADQRWNSEGFEALYCCGSEPVARAVTLDVFRMAGVVLADLRTEARPQLVEIGWSGPVVDVSTGPGVLSAGFLSGYPASVPKNRTRAAAKRWHSRRAEGVCCRSASLGRMGKTSWKGDHRAWCELALWPGNWVHAAQLLRRPSSDRWLTIPPQGCIVDL